MAVNDINERFFMYLYQIIYAPEQAVLDRSGMTDAEEKLAKGLDLLLQFVQEGRQFGNDLASGCIESARLPSRKNVMAGPLKAVHSMLEHLIWLMGEVANGDYKQRLSVASDLSRAFNTMVECLVELAWHDKITGILNTDGFDEKAALILRKAPPEKRYFLLSVTVNDFKDFYTFYGSEKSDELLKRVAVHLCSLCGGDEICARVYADNFMCLFAGVSAESVARRLCVDTTVVWNGITAQKQLFQQGIYAVTDRKQPIRDMRNYATFANKSMPDDMDHYEFDQAMERQFFLKKRILEQFEQALHNREFVVYYQPKVDAQSEAVVGYEALVRWNSPEDGLVSPGVFINLFEANGLITLLDFYVLGEVCRKLRQLRDEGIPIMPVAVNFSRVHLRDADFVETVLQLLEKWEIKSDWIEIEVTETGFFENQRIIVDVVEQFHAAGLSVAMDDFGSGYSSLNFLKNIPVDVIKIDQMFFDNFETDQRVRLLLKDILSMAHHLEVHTVAEGVETAAQVAFLKKNGCTMIQGYYFYKPLSERDVMAIMKEAQ